MRWFVFLLAVSCCHPQPIPTPPPTAGDMVPAPQRDMTGMTNIYGLPFCPSSMSVTYADVCDALFTKDGLACAHCTGASACYDDVDSIYCSSAGPGCLGDPACYRVRDGVTARKPSIARRPK